MKRMVPYLLSFFGGIVAGALSLWFFSTSHQEALLSQVIALAEVSRDAQKKSISVDRYVEKLRGENFEIKSTDHEQGSTVIEMRPEHNFLGIGGKWVILLSTNDSGEIKSAMFEFHTVGYP